MISKKRKISIDDHFSTIISRLFESRKDHDFEEEENIDRQTFLETDFEAV